MHNIISYCDITKRNFLSPGGSNGKNCVNTFETNYFMQWMEQYFLGGFLKKRGKPYEGNFETFLLRKSDFVNRISGWITCLCKENLVISGKMSQEIILLCLFLLWTFLEFFFFTKNIFYSENCFKTWSLTTRKCP